MDIPGVSFLPWRHRNPLAVIESCFAHKEKAWPANNRANKKTAQNGIRQCAFGLIALVPFSGNFSDIFIHDLIMKYITENGCIVLCPILLPCEVRVMLALAL